MRIAVITCEKYSDCWRPFQELFRKFWPECTYPVELWSNRTESETWCEVVSRCAKDAEEESVLLMQDDFFLTVTPLEDMIDHANYLLYSRNAGCVRLYPSPGANSPIRDQCFGSVLPGTPYRISCQASIFDPAYLYEIASQCHDHGEASDFEIGGTRIAESIDRPVLAWKRDVKPWPLEYISSAITRGEWNPEALRWCADNGVHVDTSRRPVAI